MGGNVEREVPERFESAVRAQMSEISAASQLLQRRITSAQEREYLLMISRGVARTINALEQWELLERIRGSEDGLAPALAPIDLVEWCGGVVERAGELLGLRGLTLTFRTELKSLVSAGERGLLDRMLYLLLANAAEAKEGGGEIVVTLARSERSAILAVGDVSSEYTKRLLEQGGDLLSRGTDLEPGSEASRRLRLARVIAAGHQGTLVLDHNAGSTRAAVVLPLLEAPVGRLESPGVWGRGMSTALTALSDVLPVSAYGAQHPGA